MNRHYIPGILISIAAALFLLSFSACGLRRVGVYHGEEQKPMVVEKRKGGPPPHAPAHGYRAKYAYLYYPSTCVYFDVHRKCYFYLEGNSWKVSLSLPKHLLVRLGDHVTIEMDTDKPYTNFKEHKRKYPPGKLKKKKEHTWS